MGNGDVGTPLTAPSAEAADELRHLPAKWGVDTKYDGSQSYAQPIELRTPVSAFPNRQQHLAKVRLPIYQYSLLPVCCLLL